MEIFCRTKNFGSFANKVPMQKMLWISTTGNFNHHNQSVWVSSATFVSVNGCFSINGISICWRPYRFRVLVWETFNGYLPLCNFTSGSLCGHWSKLLLIIITLLSVCIFHLRKNTHLSRIYKNHICPILAWHGKALSALFPLEEECWLSTADCYFGHLQAPRKWWAGS